MYGESQRERVPIPAVGIFGRGTNRWAVATRTSDRTRAGSIVEAVHTPNASAAPIRLRTPRLVRSSDESVRPVAGSAISPPEASSNHRFGRPHAASGFVLPVWEQGRPRPRRRPNASTTTATTSPRTPSFTPSPKPPLARGYWKLYADHVLQANEGADLDFLVGRSGALVPRDNH